MKKQLISISMLSLLLLLLPSFAAAELDQFQLFITPIKDRIMSNEIAYFNLTLLNNQNYADDYNIEVDFSRWSVESSPLFATKTMYGWTVNANSSDTITIYLKPSLDTSLGTYKVEMLITSRATGVRAKKDAVVNVRPAGLPYGEYVPTITATIDLTNNGILDPRSTATVFISLDNYVPIKLENLTVEVRSKLINHDLKVTLDPLERKTEQFTVTLDPLERPMKEFIFMDVLNGKESLKKVRKEYEIIAYSTFDKEEYIKKGFLKKTTLINYTNHGNVNRIDSTRMQTGYISKLFTKTSPAAKAVKQDGKLYFVWELNLEPEKTIQITAEESYRTLALLSLIIVVSLTLYFVLRSPIIVQKEAKIMQRGEGGISELKVLLYIRNRTMKPIYQIKVLDKIPHVADLHEEVIIGTLKPSKIIKDAKKGTLVEWDIPMLEGYEERIISYKLKSKLSILGFFNLPAALLKFKKNDQIKSVKSNRIKAALK
ncbi:MAG: hypothetical protein Q8O89_02265 [Nanoarchaeota archaeon]|nr:hypothetical protein [Nanoarchaeota archaeon]